MELRTVQSHPESSSRTALLAKSDTEFPAPIRAGDVATDDERDKSPALSALRQHVEVMPLRPCIAVGDAVAGQVEMIELIPQLERRRRNPSPVPVVVFPLSRENLREGADCACRRRDLTRSVDRILGSIAAAQIQQSPLDLRRYCDDLSRVPR